MRRVRWQRGPRPRASGPQRTPPGAAGAAAGARRRAAARAPRIAALAAALALALAATPALSAQDAPAAPRGDAPYEITADVIEFDRQQALFLAEGDVVMVQRRLGRRLEADWVAFSDRTGRGVASGDVVLVEGDRRVEAEFALFDVETLQGLLRRGGFESFDERRGTGVRVWAEELVRTGVDDYELWEGAFTTCRCPDEDARDPWRVRASRADIELGGYGTVRNATFDILGVPVIWLPWMIFPVKSEREAGLLFPQFGLSGRNGIEIGQPLFLTLGDPVNLTLTPRWLSERGVKGEARLEYVAGEESWGDLRVSYLRDRRVLRNEDDAQDENAALVAAGRPPTASGDAFDADRWAVRFESQSHPGDWLVMTDINLGSDNEHPEDFDELRDFRRDRFMESRVFASRSFGRSGAWGAVGGVEFADDLQAPDDQDRDDFLLHRAPDLRLRWLPQPTGGPAGLVASLDARAVQFRALRDPGSQVAEQAGDDAPLVDDRFYDTGIDGLGDGKEGAARTVPADFPGFDPTLDRHDDNFAPAAGSFGPQGDGVFQEGEPLADEGLRLELSPRLARPFRPGGAVELVPEVGYRQFLYATDEQGVEERGAFVGRLDLRTRFEGRGDGWLHVVEPVARALLVEARGQAGDPFFVPPTRLPQERLRLLDPESVLSDPVDRLEDRRALVLGVANRFYGSSARGRTPLGELTLLGEWDPLADSALVVLDGRSWMRAGLQSRFHVTWDPEDLEVDEGLVEVARGFGAGSRASLRYRFRRRIPLFFESFRGDNRDRFDEFEEDIDRVNQLSAGLRTPLGAGFHLTANAVYELDEKILLAAQGGIDYVSRCGCWAAGVLVQQNRRRGPEATFRITLLTPGEDVRRPFSGSSPFGLQSGF